MTTSKESGTAKRNTTRNRTPRAQAKATRTTARGKRAKSAPSTLAVNAEERWRMIAVAAYHKAEQRGFAPGGAENDWFEAEKEVDALLGVQQGQQS